MEKITLYTVKGYSEEYGYVFILSYIGANPSDVANQVMEKARGEGYRGSIHKRLKSLGWEIVELEAVEVSNGKS